MSSVSRRGILGPGVYSDTPFHTHDFDEISGVLNVSEAQIGSLSATRITAGTIGVEVIKLSDSANSRIESFDGTSLIIRGDGSFVGTSVTITGAVNATTGTLTNLTVDGDLTMGVGGRLRTAVSGERIEISRGDRNQVQWFSGLSGELSQAYIDASDAGGGIPRLLIVGPVATTGKTDPSAIQIFGNSGIIDIGSLGSVLIGAGGGGSAGNINLTAGSDGSSGVIIVGNGTASNPALMIGAETDGIYRPASGQLAMSINNVVKQTWKATETTYTQPNRGAIGSVTVPTWSFDTDSNTGMYRVSENVIGLAAGGIEGVRISSSRLESIGLDTGEFSLVHSQAGTSGTPTYSFVGDSDTGMYRPAGDRLAFATNGVERLRFESTGHTRFTPAGTVSLPTIALVSDADTGVFWPAANEIGLTSGGAEMFTGLNTSPDEVRILPINGITDGSDPFVRVSTTGLLRKDSSARWLKKNISDALGELAAVPIPHPSRFQWRAQKTTDPIDDVNATRWAYGWVADQWADSLSEVAMYDGDGRASNYELKGVVAHVAAHTIALEEQVDALQAEVAELRESLEQFAVAA